MRRPGRTTPHTTPRMRWMASSSPGVPTPMDMLMSWLERHGEEYRTSKRKIDLLEQLGEEMATNGIYGLTVSSIRSQISRLKNGVQMKAEGGKCTSTDVNRYYDRLLSILFDEEERAEMRELASVRATTAAAAAEDERERTIPRESRRIRSRSNAPQEAMKTESDGTDETEVDNRGQEARPLPNVNLHPIDPILDTMEIRRRFELLSARQGLQQQGVDRETIDSMLPLRRE